MHIIDVSYSDMLKSYIEKGSWFLLYKYTPNEVTLDIPLIRQELSHYFYSSQSSNYVRGTRYGISAADYYANTWQDNIGIMRIWIIG